MTEIEQTITQCHQVRAGCHIPTGQGHRNRSEQEGQGHGEWFASPCARKGGRGQSCQHTGHHCPLKRKGVIPVFAAVSQKPWIPQDRCMV